MSSSWPRGHEGGPLIWLYNLALLVIIGLGAPLWLFWALVSPKRRRGLGERLRPLPRLEGRPLWIHAASVGEAEAAKPLIRALRERSLPLVLTTTSLTGRDRLREAFPMLTVRLLPLDLPGLMHRSVRRVDARTLALIETELWPNLIHAAHAGGARVAILSGRISDRSYPRYRALRLLVAPLLRRVGVIGARSEEDARRFAALGAEPRAVSAMGDLKLDRPPAPPPGDELKQALGSGPFLIGGSTHAGEEEALLSVWRELRAGPAPQLRLVLVPRHPERVSAVCASARRQGAAFALRSAGAAAAEVVIVDSVGELASLYTLADLVFAGGTLANIGGHNLVEPVQAGKVVVHGPHTWNQRHQVRLLEPYGVLRAVADARSLREVLFELWRDPERNAPARAAMAALEQHRGALGRALTLLLPEETRHA